jgi:uncharacterized RDD family membrane protein YckC
MTDPEAPVDIDFDIDLSLRESDDTLPASVQWDDNFAAAGESASPGDDWPVVSHRDAVVDADTLADEAALAESPATLEIADPDPDPPAEPWRESSPRVDRRFPLFGSTRPADDSDEPLIKVPAAPRAPLAVRRTPETPRLRAVPRSAPRPSRAIEAAPALDFAGDAPAPIVESMADVRARTASRLAGPTVHAAASGPGARAAAAAIDHLLLGAIDLAVVYFTLRMTGLTMAGLSTLPITPLAAFLLLVKLSYFCAFTAVGGQTIGKMAMRIRVVTSDDQMVDGALAMKRTLFGAASAVLLGLGFLPALFGAERCALHDRLTRTRVVALPSA